MPRRRIPHAGDGQAGAGGEEPPRARPADEPRAPASKPARAGQRGTRQRPGCRHGQRRGKPAAGPRQQGGQPPGSVRPGRLGRHERGGAEEQQEEQARRRRPARRGPFGGETPISARRHGRGRSRPSPVLLRRRRGLAGRGRVGSALGATGGSLPAVERQERHALVRDHGQGRNILEETPLELPEESLPRLEDQVGRGQLVGERQVAAHEARLLQRGEIVRSGAHPYLRARRQLAIEAREEFGRRGVPPVRALEAAREGAARARPRARRSSRARRGARRRAPPPEGRAGARTRPRVPRRGATTHPWAGRARQPGPTGVPGPGRLAGPRTGTGAETAARRRGWATRAAPSGSGRSRSESGRERPGGVGRARADAARRPRPGPGSAAAPWPASSRSNGATAGRTGTCGPCKRSRSGPMLPAWCFARRTPSNVPADRATGRDRTARAGPGPRILPRSAWAPDGGARGGEPKEGAGRAAGSR